MILGKMFVFKEKSVYHMIEAIECKIYKILIYFDLYKVHEKFLH